MLIPWPCFQERKVSLSFAKTSHRCAWYRMASHSIERSIVYSIASHRFVHVFSQATSVARTMFRYHFTHVHPLICAHFIPAFHFLRGNPRSQPLHHLSSAIVLRTTRLWNPATLTNTNHFHHHHSQPRFQWLLFLKGNYSPGGTRFDYIQMDIHFMDDLQSKVCISIVMYFKIDYLWWELGNYTYIYIHALCGSSLKRYKSS